VGEGVFVSGLLLCGICFMVRLNLGLCLCMYRSLVILVNRDSVCRSVRTCLAGGPFFPCGLYPLCFTLCRMCVVCLVCVVQI
jgi:hypothetical protein